jgi:hypothetical protein
VFGGGKPEIQSVGRWARRGLNQGLDEVRKIALGISLTCLPRAFTIAHGFGRNGPARRVARRTERGPGFRCVEILDEALGTC